jgi:hypothetical protein
VVLLLSLTQATISGIAGLHLATYFSWWNGVSTVLSSADRSKRLVF